MKVRIVYRPDKTVAVIHPAPKSRKPSETEEQWLKRIFDKAVKGTLLEGLPYDDIDSSQLPQSRDSRDAWEGEKGKGITINQTKVQQLEQERQKKEQDKLSAINKLKALGLTEDEIIVIRS
ncbi:hypothetical protein AYK26_07720 [Euryarchaeota archaeon SM23-78]|nr:MAG: hypothetical protein AYK26_07720 [Euryarchaeota archaeon SM23-78]